MAQKDVRYVSVSRTGFYKVYMSKEGSVDDGTSFHQNVIYNLSQFPELGTLYIVEAETGPHYSENGNTNNTITVVVLTTYNFLITVLGDMISKRGITSFTITSEDHTNSVR